MISVGVSLELNMTDSVNGLDCCDKFWRGTVSFEDAQQEVVIGRVVGFDEIHEADVRGEVVVPLRVEECF
jgi:hypothetical protein